MCSNCKIELTFFVLILSRFTALHNLSVVQRVVVGGSGRNVGEEDTEAVLKVMAQVQTDAVC